MSVSPSGSVRKDQVVVGRDGKTYRFGWAHFTVDGVSVVAPTVNGRVDVHVYGLTDDPRPR